MDFNQWAAVVRAMQHQQLLQQRLLLDQLHLAQQHRQQQQTADAQRAAAALAIVVQSQEENALQEASDFSSLMCANSIVRDALLAAAQGQLYFDLAVLTQPGLAEKACGWLVEHMQLIGSFSVRGELSSWEDEHAVSEKLSSVIAEAEAAHSGSVVFSFLELPELNAALPAQLPVTLTHLSFSFDSYSSLPDRLTALTNLKQLSLMHWAGSATKLLPLTALPALTQLSLQADRDPEEGPRALPSVKVAAWAMGEELAPVLRALPVGFKALNVEQTVERVRNGMSQAGIDALSRLTMLTRLHLLGCSAVDGEHTGMAAQDARAREGVVWAVTPQQLGDCLRQLHGLVRVQMKNVRLQWHRNAAGAGAGSSAGGGNSAGACSSAGASSSAVGPVVVAGGFDMLPVVAALAGLPRLTALRCYNILIGPTASGLKGASKLRTLELNECHVSDEGLVGMLQGFASSSSLKSLGVGRQAWRGVTAEFHGHVWSSSPVLTQHSLDAIGENLLHLEFLDLKAQPNITPKQCHALIAQMPSLHNIIVSYPWMLDAFRQVWRGGSEDAYKVLRGSQDHHNAYGPVTGSDTESEDEQILQNMAEAEMMAQEEAAYGGYSDDFDGDYDYPYPFYP